MKVLLIVALACVAYASGAALVAQTAQASYNAWPQQWWAWGQGDHQDYPSWTWPQSWQGNWYWSTRNQLPQWANQQQAQWYQQQAAAQWTNLPQGSAQWTQGQQGWPYYQQRNSLWSPLYQGSWSWPQYQQSPYYPQYQQQGSWPWTQYTSWQPWQTAY